MGVTEEDGGANGEPDSISNGGFEPDFYEESSNRERQMSQNDSFDSIFDDQTARLSPNANRIVPHQSYNPDGTNNLFTIFLIVNAALGKSMQFEFLLMKNKYMGSNICFRCRTIEFSKSI